MYPYSIGEFSKLATDVSFETDIYKKSSLPVLHAHTNYEFLFIKRGTFTAICNNRFYDGAAPCMVFYNEGCYHGTARINAERNNFERYCMYFDNTAFSNVSRELVGLDWILSQDFVVLPLAGNESVFELLDYAVKNADTPAERTACFLLIASRINKISALSESITYGCFEDKYVLEAIKYIVSESGNGKIVTVSDLARRFNVCASKLLGDFKKLTGSTPKSYVKKCTLDRAVSLLNNGTSVGETASLCGFSSTSYFIQFFNRQTGVSPGAYQKKKEA